MSIIGKTLDIVASSVTIALVGGNLATGFAENAQKPANSRTFVIEDVVRAAGLDPHNGFGLSAVRLTLPGTIYGANGTVVVNDAKYPQRLPAVHQAKTPG